MKKIKGIIKHMQIQFEQLKERLAATNTISYKEICDIMDAFQIASGQGFAIGKTKALLDFLYNGHTLTIENFEHTPTHKLITTTTELATIFIAIDAYVDLLNDKHFKDYF
jgi:hypothetical protein